MGKTRNVLFIMCDQLRADHLSCTGHPGIETPHLDALAARGVVFDRSYVQSPVCGPSRMSYYTGRYAYSHGSSWNFVPLSVRERTLGDYLGPQGVRVAIVGKTHVTPDIEGMERLGIDPKSERGKLLGDGGFEPYLPYEGAINPGPDHPYVRYLRDQGYTGDDPWNDYVNSADGPGGTLLSTWNMRNLHLPARVGEADSETAYTTDRAIDFIEEAAENPWLLHLSYIKPHWPYMAPAPYHNMYTNADCAAPNRSPKELEDPHPVYAAFTKHEEARTFARDGVAAHVRPVYLGLVKQIDDHIGRLMAKLEKLGRLDDTMIVFTSDHGDFLGDHWLGEKEMFFEESAHVPLIVYDPDTGADSTRGTHDSRFVEAIDMLPTFLESLGVEPPAHLIEGRSLLPLLHDAPNPEWRDAAISELDYSFRDARRTLGRGPRECHGTMVRTDRWKYIDWEGYRPQLFDLDSDPKELVDLGADPGFEEVRREMRDRLLEWLRTRKTRITATDERANMSFADLERELGIQIGVW